MAPRGFEAAEFHARLARAQTKMQKAEISALLLTTEPEIRYITGFLTRFWESPTRPWFVVVPASGAPIAVIPSIGKHLMSQTWVTDIRTWQSPDYEDDGVSVLAETLLEATSPGEKIGLPAGMETHIRMPMHSWGTLKIELATRVITGDDGIMRDLRLIKSEAEITKIRTACNIASAAFDRVPEIASEGAALSDVFRRFQVLALEEGADWVSYLAGAAGTDGYGDVISPATGTPLKTGDVLMLDTGCVHDGYFSDYDRNFAIGRASDAARSGYARLLEAEAAAFNAACPGATASDLFHAMAKILGGSNEAGRLGHGLGMQLTEWPSLVPADHTVLEPGMVLTLEPGVEVTNGKILVHEENIVITETGAEYLSPPAPRELPVL